MRWLTGCGYISPAFSNSAVCGSLHIADYAKRAGMHSSVALAPQISV